jgi:hypothetical protein
MITDEEDCVRARTLPLEIVWRNPQRQILPKLRLREAISITDGRSEPRKYARRKNGDTNHDSRAWALRFHRLTEGETRKEQWILILWTRFHSGSNAQTRMNTTEF